MPFSIEMDSLFLLNFSKYWEMYKETDIIWDTGRTTCTRTIRSSDDTIYHFCQLDDVSIAIQQEIFFQFFFNFKENNTNEDVLTCISTKIKFSRM